MPIKNHTIRPDGLYIENEGSWLALNPYSSRAVRVRYSLKAEFSSRESLIVTSQPQEPCAFSLEEIPGALLFKTAEITIRIDCQSAALEYFDQQGVLLTGEPARGGKTLEPVDVLRSVFDQASTIESSENVDGVRIQASNVRQVVDRQAFHARLEFEWVDGEALYGLGSHEEGMLNLRGQHQYLYQENMKAVVPVLVSSRGYAVFMDCYSLMTFHDDAFGSYLWADVVDDLDFYFIYGPEFDEIVHQLRSLSGRATMLPKWSFGYIQSKERYINQEEILEIVSEYRRRKLALDGIVLDWKSWTGELWGQKTFDPNRFPDPSRMNKDLHKLNAHLMVSIWPIMRPGGPNWQELHDKGLLLGNQATYDAFNEEARACYWKQANEGLFSHGIDAWWCDCTEPFEADWKGAVKPEPEERLRINTEEAKRYLDPEYINAYSLVHSKGIYDGQRSVTADKRVINLNRSAYLGQQRYGTVTWSGDTYASWKTMRRQIADGLNFCVTGMPYWTLDIGAFFVGRKAEMWFWCGEYDGGVEDMGYRELFVRWFQYGAFLPMFRAHGTDTPREIWRFGEPGQPMYDALVNALELRYRLLPYIYSLAGWTTQRDYTMLRVLAFDFRSDAHVYNIRDQFMFGPALLVSPVTDPMYYLPGSVAIHGAAQTRSVYLPAENGWYDFWTGRYYAGGQSILADAPLEHLPLFVRAGSIIPMGPNRQHVNDLPDAPTEVHIYPGRDASFLLYEDEGDNYNYEEGAYATIPINWQESAGKISMGERQGSYQGMPGQHEFIPVLHTSNAAVIRVKPVIYTGEVLEVDLKNWLEEKKG